MCHVAFPTFVSKMSHLRLFLCALCLLQSSGAKSAGDDVYENLNIVPYYDVSFPKLQVKVKDVQLNCSSDSNGRTEEGTLIQSMLIPAIKWLNAVIKVKQLSDVLTFERGCSGSAFIINNTRYCQGSCAVSTCGPVLVPTHHLEPCRCCDKLGHNCSSEGGGRGWRKGHLLLYVSLIDSIECQTSARMVHSGHCLLDKESGRPVAGYINFCPNKVSTYYCRVQPPAAIVLQQLLHIMAFDYELLPYFHDSDGLPRTASGLPMRYSDGSYKLPPSMLRRVYLFDRSAKNGTTLRVVTMLSTPAVQSEVQRLFNCSTLIGAELESVNILSSNMFWKRDVFEGELMTAAIDSHPVISRITLALLEDSGWYIPDYQQLKMLSWNTDFEDTAAAASRFGELKPVASYCAKFENL